LRPFTPARQARPRMYPVPGTLPFETYLETVLGERRTHRPSELYRGPMLTARCSGGDALGQSLPESIT